MYSYLLQIGRKSNKNALERVLKKKNLIHKIWVTYIFEVGSTKIEKQTFLRLLNSHNVITISFHFCKGTKS